MSEANRDQSPNFVEGELSLDDLSQIAGGTLTPANFSFDNTNTLAPSDGLFDGAKAVSNDSQNMGSTMNMTLTFP